jgi:hypothetical protein
MTTKTSGLGQNCYVDGFDLSGDIGAIDSISGPNKPFDVTGINKSAHERIGGQRDGNAAFTAFFNPTGAHPVLSALPTTDGSVMVATGTVIGSPAACMVAKQLNYDGTRQQDGSFTLKSEFQANAFGLEWGTLLTAGLRTDTTATSGASLDGGGGFATPAVPASTTPVTNTSALPATVVVSAGTLTNVSVNGATVGTGDGTYTVPPGGTIAITYSVAPTWTWTLQTAYGAQMYLQVTGFTGTDATIKVQDSADGVTFADLAGAAFTAVTTANQGQRLAISNGAAVRRYLRVATTTSGGFTSVTFAVAFVRNLTAGQVF